MFGTQTLPNKLEEPTSIHCGSKFIIIIIAFHKV